VTTVTEFEKRLLRACMTIRALPDPEARFFSFRAIWPDAVNATEEAYGYDEARLPRFRPTPADVSDCLPSLALMRGLPRREWRLIWWRSLGWSFRGIAAKIGRSDETARQRYRDVVLKIWLNYQKVTWQSPANQGSGRISLGNQRAVIPHGSCGPTVGPTRPSQPRI
jgi:uncharacterized protein DUF6362